MPENRNGSCGTKPIAAAEALERDLTDIDAVDEDRAGRRLVQSRQQAEQRRLAGAGGADEGGGRSGLDPEGDVGQHRESRRQGT